MLALKKTMTMLYTPANMYIFMSEVKQLNMQIYGAWLTVVSTTNWLNLSAQEVTDFFLSSSHCGFDLTTTIFHVD